MPDAWTGVLVGKMHNSRFNVQFKHIKAAVEYYRFIFCRGAAYICGAPPLHPGKGPSPFAIPKQKPPRASYFSPRRF